MDPFLQNWITTSTAESTFTISFGKFKVNSTGITHAVNQYKYMYDCTGLPFAILLSGGIDSQSTVLAAVKAKVPFKIFSLRFNDNLNMHDLRTGIELAACLGVNINFVDIDILKFFNSGEYAFYLEKYATSSPQMAALLWFYSKVSDNNCLISPGNPVIKINDDFEGINNYTLFAWERFAKINNISMIGLFLWYSPEMFGSIFRIFTSYTYNDKCKIYKQNGFNIIPQQSKLNGFEQVKEVYIAKYPHSKWPFDAFFRYPYEKKYNKQTILHGINT